MKKPKISIICALAKDRAIGYKDKLLWDIPADMKHFQKLTTGHPVIMGWKTFKSIGRPLPNRTNIVLYNLDKKIKNCIIVNSLEKAINVAKKTGDSEIFIIGGASVYAQTIDVVDKLYLTIIDGKYKADTFFPDYSKFKKIISQKSEESNGYKYKFLELERG